MNVAEWAHAIAAALHRAPRQHPTPGWVTAGQTLRPLPSKVIHNKRPAYPKERTT